jgi:hypothetical protein
MEEKTLKYSKEHVKMDKLPEFHYFLSPNSSRKKHQYFFFWSERRGGGLVSASTIIIPEKFTSTVEARETNTNFLPIIIVHYKYASTEKRVVGQQIIRSRGKAT